MAKLRRIIGGGFRLVALGYALGVITAPRSGKQTRRRIKKSTKKSVRDIERDLKTVYSQTKATLNIVAKDNPEVTAKIKNAKEAAQKSQSKVKNLLSAIHGQDNVDDDLEAALKDAKSVLQDLKQFITK